MKTEIKAPHGRETYIVNFGDGFVMKRPLPESSDSQKEKWLEKQHRTKSVIDEIVALKNPVYNIPKMIHIKDDEYQLLEERAPGSPLTRELYNGLNNRQQYEIINSVAHFLVDMNELKDVSSEFEHRISDEVKMIKFENIVTKKMPVWFGLDEVRFMEDLMLDIESFEYVTRKAWSHSDLNAGNVLYDAKTSRISFIDFAEADYNFIFRDIFSPLAMDLGICKPLYAEYMKLHDKTKYYMPGYRSSDVPNIMRYRIIVALLKRFIKAGDDLRMNPQHDKTVENNNNKIRFMRDVILQLQMIER